MLHGPSLGFWRFGNLAGCSDLNVEAEEKVRRSKVEAVIHLDSPFGSTLRMARSRVEAKDLVQETYLRAFRFYGRFEPGTNCRARLSRILTSVFIKGVNSLKSRHKLQVYGEPGDGRLHASQASFGFVQNPYCDTGWISAELAAMISGHIFRIFRRDSGLQ